jgi:DMSO/TMAO reductase YedYZ molybdopterin-dependent catalytic subunit
MVFSPLHLLPSAIAAVLLISIVLQARQKAHKSRALLAVLFGLVGLAGYISSGNVRIFPVDFHVFHSVLGFMALLISVSLLLDRMLVHKIRGRLHRRLGYAAAALAAISLISGLWMLSGQVIPGGETPKELTMLQESVSSVLPEKEANEYQGIMLMPISSQGNNAIEGTQYIDKASYRLEVSGLVNKSQNLSYEELLALPAYSEVAYMPCVEGWGFYAKWTGFRVMDLLNRSGLQPDADYVVFHTAEGYSTGLPLDYLRDNSILMAYGLNDMTLPPERGFPFQLVAKSRYGYKWAKWITRIEVTDKEQRGYWEARGYSNSARVGEAPFG